MEVLVAFLCARQQLNNSWELLPLGNRCCNEGWFTLNYWQSSGKSGEKSRLTRTQKIWPKSRDKSFECCEEKWRKNASKVWGSFWSWSSTVKLSSIRTPSCTWTLPLWKELKATGICFLKGRILFDQLGKKMPEAGPNSISMDLKYTWDKCSYYSKVLVRRKIPFLAHAV